MTDDSLCYSDGLIIFACRALLMSKELTEDDPISGIMDLEKVNSDSTIVGAFSYNFYRQQQSYNI